jgi:hypothetical protein
MKDDRKRPFWDRGKDKERERDHDRDLNRDRERREEDTPAELTKLIGMLLTFTPIPPTFTVFKGYLTATGSEDWGLVLEVCERASATESKAKEAAKALRREFKYVLFFVPFLLLLQFPIRYAEPSAQLSAARVSEHSPFCSTNVELKKNVR